jgi:hypothetical protein
MGEVCRSRAPQIFLWRGFNHLARQAVNSLAGSTILESKGDVLARIAALLRSRLTVKAKPFPRTASPGDSPVENLPNCYCHTRLFLVMLARAADVLCSCAKL